MHFKLIVIYTSTDSNSFLFILLEMKINEKTLINYCTSNTPTDREGWLVKRGEVNKSFQKRWCVLKGNLLFYSEKQGDR